MLYLANFMMIGMLLPLFLRAPSLCDSFVPAFFISSPIFSLIVIQSPAHPYFCFFIVGDCELASSSSLSTVLVYLSYLLRTLLFQTYHYRFFKSSLIIFSFSVLSSSNLIKATVLFKLIRSCFVFHLINFSSFCFAVNALYLFLNIINIVV